MSHPFASRCFAFAALLCIVAPSVSALDMPTTDVEGSHDHPLVSRFAGSVLYGYQTIDYDQMQLPMGKYERGEISVVETVEGKITRIAYVAPAGKSALEIYRNYAQAITAAGFQARFECHGGDGPQGCGGFGFASEVSAPAISRAMGPDSGRLVIETLSPTDGNVYAMTSSLQRPEGAVDLVLMVAKDGNHDNPAGILLQICEHQPMATGQVTVDAKAIGEGLAQTGHIALYGLTFASDSASLDPASQPTLAQMAKLLTGQPALKVYIVGHTDATGDLAHNLGLSQRRAEAVVAALVKDYHIAPARLLAKGMASFAPVASNDDEAGRARNRRVELVKQ
ncbi:MAG: DUF4892 domain-containing protein [Gammaproteobacteria bacterium HGW-Gammaproteobacteria-6]|jgi:outer membrane protein OmpA-like peptidoglycan-associated protein|nr:MAG: DUF4892 domain-containing protein [Gammaproteobacteria bacterium HGW-Gammaproteobacteria-6]PKM16674.1 MAG: DUF4892 domain-containing protein [Gammaproteobacteria bacterium HGW-Gammaproteobacteria-2]